MAISYFSFYALEFHKFIPAMLATKIIVLTAMA
jgi:hypothetical protein